MIFLDRHGDGILATRGEGDNSAQVEAVVYGNSPEVMAEIAASKSRHRAHWGRVLRAPDVPLTLLNVRKSVRRDGVFAGVLIASVTVSQFSAMLAMDSEAFVLYDQRFVLAHRRLAKGFKNVSPAQPLPWVKNFGDRVLAAY